MTEPEKAALQHVAESVATEPDGDDEHAPWSYTEYGVVCACGRGMRGENCPADMTGLPAEQRQELVAARGACEAAKWPEQHRVDCAWCAYIGRWSQ